MRPVSFYLIFILLWLPLIVGCSTGEKRHIPAIILDTDIGGDIDDLGALYLLHKYADAGQCTVLAVMTSWSMAYHVDGVDAVNTWFGRPDIPVGAYDDEFFEKKEYTWFLGSQYPSDLTGREAPKSPTLYRHILAGQPDTSVTIVVTGRLNNLYDLMQTKADHSSPLTGTRLFETKVKSLTIMGGRYPTGSDREANFRNGGFRTKYVIDNCTRPIVFVGGSIGSKENGFVLGDTLNNLPDTHILKAGYGFFFKHPPVWTGLSPTEQILDWSIWDLIAVQVVVTGVRSYFDMISTGYNSLDSTGLNMWMNAPDKDHSYLVTRMNPKHYSDTVITLKILQ